MARSPRFALAVISAGSLLVFSHARADTPLGARAVIRGSGNDVQIVYRAPRPGVAAPAATDPLTEALQRKIAGATDREILAFLDLYRDRMPDIVGADLLKRFRKAGAGESVIAFLSSKAAVEIGPTAGDAAAPAAPPPYESGPYAGAFPDLVSSGYPFYGAYGYGGYGGYGGGGGLFPGGWGRRHHGFVGDRRSGFFFGFGNGFGHGRGFGPHPHPVPAPRSGGHTHASVTGGRMR